MCDNNILSEIQGVNRMIALELLNHGFEYRREEECYSCFFSEIEGWHIGTSFSKWYSSVDILHNGSFFVKLTPAYDFHREFRTAKKIIRKIIRDQHAGKFAGGSDQLEI
jgi:hypothetical protein